MSLAVSTDFAESIPRKQSLRQELYARGIKILDPKIARAHMKKEVRDSRVGVYRFAGPFLYAFSHMLNFIAMKDNLRLSLLSLLGLAAVFSALAFAGLPYVGFIPIAILLLVIGSFFAIFLFADRTDKYSAQYDPDFAGAASIWMRERLYEVDRSTLLEYGVPDKLIDRTLRARNIDGIIVSRLRFGIDPLIEVSRKRWFGTERAIIGGYDTGDDYINNF